MADGKILAQNPLTESERILRDEYYGTSSHEPEPKAKTAKPRPTHYKVVCISLYTQDIENLESKVKELKRRGYTKANKSQLIRQALRQLDLDSLPPPQQ